MFKLLLEFVILLRLFVSTFLQIQNTLSRYPSLSAETLYNLLATLMNALYQPSDDTRWMV